MNTTVGKVEKLEALLARVQRNRTQPRHGFAREASFDDAPSLVPEPDSFAPLAPSAPSPAAAPPVPRPPVRQTTEPIHAQGSATSSRSARTPLEQAVENKLERASTHPHLQPVPSPQSAAMSAPAPRPVSFSKASADEPSVIDPPPPVASRGVGQVVSKQPLIGAQTFGDLLRRSLSLRPR